MEVPEQYLSIYTDTWGRWADLIKNIYLNKCDCLNKTYHTVYKLITAAEYDLEKNNIDRFATNITFANTLLKTTYPYQQ